MTEAAQPLTSRSLPHDSALTEPSSSLSLETLARLARAVLDARAKRDGFQPSMGGHIMGKVDVRWAEEAFAKECTPERILGLIGEVRRWQDFEAVHPRAEYHEDHELETEKNQPLEPELKEEGSMSDMDTLVEAIGYTQAHVAATCAAGHDLTPPPQLLAALDAVRDRLAEDATPSLHPEATCQRCGRSNIVWFTPNDVWNAVMPDEGGILCPVCFVQAAEHAGIVAVWRLAPEVPTGEPGKPVYDSAEWWKQVAQGLSRKLWPTADSEITPTRCLLCGGTFHPNHSAESIARRLHDSCAAGFLTITAHV